MSVSRPQATTVCYSVAAQADPGLLPRLVNQLAKIGLVPDRLHSVAHDDEITVDLQVAGLPAARAALLEQRFRATVGVRWVGVSTKSAGLAPPAGPFDGV